MERRSPTRRVGGRQRVRAGSETGAPPARLRRGNLFLAITLINSVCRGGLVSRCDLAKGIDLAGGAPTRERLWTPPATRASRPNPPSPRRPAWLVEARAKTARVVLSR